MSDRAVELQVQFHNFDAKGDCLADVALIGSDIVVQNLKVKQGLGNGVIVHMPAWMHTHWSCPELEWSDVRKEVVKQYKSIQPQRLVPEVLLYDYDDKGNCFADITLPESGIQVAGLKVMQGLGGGVMVHMPAWMHTRWCYPEIQWATVRQIVTEKYKSIPKAKECEPLPEKTVQADTESALNAKGIWLDTKISVRQNGDDERVEGIHLMSNSLGQFNVYAPDEVISHLCSSGSTWDEIKSEIIEAFQECRGESPNVWQGEILTVFLDEAKKVDTNLPDADLPQKKEEPSEDNHHKTPAEEKNVKEKNEYGRIKNAENSSLKFYPRTVLRAFESDEGYQQKKKLFDLITALSKGSLGGIGPFEINILEWVDQLKYVTTTMLTDLIRGGYVATGWRKDVTQNKLPKIISRMSQYDLVALTHFVTVDDNGLPDGDSSSYSTMRILTLGKAGSTLLHELGHNTTHYNAFNVFQDGNTVKRYLAANQWLVYWLTTFPADVCENYETSTVLYQKGSDFSGARIYASVTCNDCPLVAEPLRRVEPFEQETNKLWMRHKFLRFINLFSHLDELYAGQSEISFNERPVIIYLCEDDQHIDEVWEELSDLILAHPEQEVWFTTDLRIFNYNMKGERFLRHTADGAHIVDIAARLGVNE